MKANIALAATLLIAAGCATQPRPVAPVAQMPATEDRSTAALAFDPAVARNQQQIDLSRDDRGASAFVGYEDATTTYFNTYTDDRRSTDQGQGVDKTTYSEKVGDVRR